MLTHNSQWGNMITLQAVWINPILKPILESLITAEELSILLQKTLAFLALVATPSSALYIDWKILDYTGRRNGLLPPQPPNLTGSFSSSGS